MPAFRELHDRSARLCFGAAQIGMAYGAANNTGMPGEAEAEALIREALSSGITLFDTAQAYGKSEARLGHMHKAMAAHGATIITKLAPLVLEDGETLEALEARVEAHIMASCARLQLTALPCVLLHRATHLQQYEGRIWKRLLELQAAGLIGRLGVSVSTPDEVKMALGVPGVACVQLPFNIVDGRWEREGVVALLKERRDVLVCVRSVLLQGVLMQEAEAWPMANAQAKDVAALLDGFVLAYGRESRADLCVAYVRGQSWIDVVVLGMEHMHQLRQNVALFETAALDAEACAEIAARMPVLPEAFLNPALWPKKES